MIKVSEIFGPVLQGEGYWVGTPSIFVRLFGCNFRCKFFGLKPTDYKLAGVEVKELIEQLSLYNTLEELPQVSTGCDTPFAIYKEFSKFTQSYTIPDLVAKLHDQAVSPITTGRRKYHLVITGGEPLLWQKQLGNVIPLIDKTIFPKITFETNGTQVLSDEFTQILNDQVDCEFLFSCSPKLSCSGESKLDAFNSAALRSYNKIINSFTILKFVVGQEQEIAEVQQFIKGYFIDGVDVTDVFLMPEGCKNDDHYIMNCKRVAELCNLYGYRYSPRLQVELFNNGAGT